MGLVVRVVLGVREWGRILRPLVEGDSEREEDSEVVVVAVEGRQAQNAWEAAETSRSRPPLPPAEREEEASAGQPQEACRSACHPY